MKFIRLPHGGYFSVAAIVNVLFFEGDKPQATVTLADGKLHTLFGDDATVLKDFIVAATLN